MEMTTFAPCEALAPLVRSFRVVETEEEATRSLIPDTGVILGFRYSGSATLIEGENATLMPDASLAGLRLTTRRMRTSAGGGIVLATFREGAAMPFFQEPMHPLFSSIVGLDEWVSGEEIDEVRSKIAGAADNATRVGFVEQFLLAHMAMQQRDMLVAAAVRAIQAARGSISIRSLADHLGISQDRFEKRFRQAVGASPKQFCSILRLRRVVQSWRPGDNLTSLALDAGYYDQPHFIREFRSVTGEAPQRFLHAGDHC
jgi:AraC-like DNA-binding protein